jgi:hypothetical protein
MSRLSPASQLEEEMEDHEEERVELRAMKFAEDYYEKVGWKVMNVSRDGGEYAGYDLLLEKGSEKRKVEVKGCRKLYGIPDFYEAEINRESKRLVADELCVVYFLPNRLRKLAIIRREDILPDNLVPKLGYRLRKFKNAKVMKKFFIQIDGVPPD